MSDVKIDEILAAVRKQASTLTKAPMADKSMPNADYADIYIGGICTNPDNERSYRALMSFTGEKFIRNLYRILLDRDCSPEEISAMTELSDNRGKEYVLAAVALSPECRRLGIDVEDVDMEKLDVNMLLGHEDTEFVCLAYRWILGRPADEEDVSSHRDLLRSGKITKYDLLAALKASPEGSARRVILTNTFGARRRNILYKLSRRIPIFRMVDSQKRELEEVKRQMSDLEALLKNTESLLKDTVRQKDEILDRLSVVDTFVFDKIWKDEERLKVLNRELSTHPTVWGDPRRLHVSSKASVDTCLFNVNSGEITVGDYSFAGSRVSILAGMHDINLDGLIRRDENPVDGCDINIGRGVWLASGCILLGPCSIGDNSVIAAGAVVTPGTVVPPNKIYGGVPAREIGSIDGPDSEAKHASALRSALGRTGGVLFEEGFTEKKTCDYLEGRPVGHYMESATAVLLTDRAKAGMRYYLNSDSPLLLEVGTYETTLYPGEGRFDIVCEGADAGADNDVKIRRVILQTDGKISSGKLWISVGENI